MFLTDRPVFFSLASDHKMADEYTGRHLRAEDRKLSWRIARHWAQWSWVIAPATALVVAAGFGFTTPTSHFDELHEEIKKMDTKFTGQIDTLRMKQDAGFNDRVDQRHILEFIARVRCVELTDQQKAKLGGTDVCDGVMHPLDHAIKTHIRAPMEPIQ